MNLKALRLWFEVHLQLRERLLVTATILALVGFGWWNYYADPTIQTIQETRQRIDATNTRVDALKQALQKVQADLRGDHNEAKKIRVAELKKVLLQLDDELHSKTLELISPQQMISLFNGLLSQKYGLKLVTLERLQVEPVFNETPESVDATELPEVYRHYVALNLEGNFEQIVAYLKQLEGLEWRLLWDEIAIETAEYPTIRLSLRLSTLSTQQVWIGV